MCQLLDSLTKVSLFRGIAGGLLCSCHLNSTWSPCLSGSGSSSLQKYLLLAPMEGSSGLLLPQGSPTAGTHCPESPFKPLQRATCRCGCCWCCSSLGPWSGDGAVFSPGSRKISHRPLRYMDPKTVWPCAPSLSWIFSERDQLSLQPLSLPGAQALSLVYIWLPSSLFSENRLLPKLLYFSVHRPSANLPASLADQSRSWSKHTSVLTWFTLLRKDLMSIRFIWCSVHSNNFHIDYGKMPRKKRSNSGLWFMHLYD